MWVAIDEGGPGLRTSWVIGERGLRGVVGTCLVLGQGFRLVDDLFSMHLKGCALGIDSRGGGVLLNISVSR